MVIGSPIVKHHDAFTILALELLYILVMLDTHDTLRDHYKYLRSAEEIESTFCKGGIMDIETVYSDNGVETRANKFS
jgi:hypothetical protein